MNAKIYKSIMLVINILIAQVLVLSMVSPLGLVYAAGSGSGVISQETATDMPSVVESTDTVTPTPTEDVTQSSELTASETPMPTETPTEVPVLSQAPVAEDAGNSSGGQVLSFHWDIPSYELTKDNNGYDQVVIPGFDPAGEPGSPSLAGRVYNIGLPPEVDLSSVQVEIVSEVTEILTGSFEIAPVAPPAITQIGMAERAAKPPPPPEEPLVDGKKLSIYQKDAFFPQASIELLGTSQMRKWQYARIIYHPVQYNPVTKELRLTSAIDVQISYESRAESSPEIPANLADTFMDDLAAQILDNFDQAQQWYPIEEAVPVQASTSNYVIVTTNTIYTGAQTAINNFLTDKQARGLTTTVITETQYGGLTGQSPNRTAQKIRKWLQDNRVSKSIQYVLLIGNPDPYDRWTTGDVEGDVPMILCWPAIDGDGYYYDSPTDYYYADLTGNWDLNGDTDYCDYPLGDMGSGGVDLAAEVYVGRIPVYTSISGWQTTLNTILQKIISYEQATTITWRKTVLLPMSFSDASTDGAYLAESMKSNYLNSRGFSSYTLYQQGSFNASMNSTYPSDAELRNGVTRTRWADNDYGIVTWWGHGSETGAHIGFGGNWDGVILESSDIFYLDDSHPAIVYMNSCTNGTPESSSNLGYSVLKQGGVGTVSASRVSWYSVGVWSPSRTNADNAAIGYYFINQVSAGTRLGSALYGEKVQMNRGWGGPSWMNLFDFNLYGDSYLSINDTIPVQLPGAFNTIAPVNGATGVSTSPTLSWGTSSGATSYEYCIDTSDNSTCNTSWVDVGNVTSKALSGLPSNTLHYWQVRAKNTAGTTDANSGTWWSFRTQVALPGAFNTTAPANGATGVSKAPTLSWGVSSGATSYVYCIDTSDNSACNTSWVDVGNVTSKALSGLLSDTMYYWVVRAKNAAGYTYANGGTWWNFRTQALPGTFNTIAPANGATGISTTPTLSWGVSSGATSYVYCIDTSNNSTCNTSWVDVGNVTSKALSGLLSNTQYYWVVRARNAAGYTYANSGTWWSFHTQVALPGAFNTTAPANGATGVSKAPTLSWGVSSGATSYVYCIDTSDNSACNTSWVDVGNVTSKALSGLLSDTIYYWVVRAKNAAGYTYANGGTWWNFRTQALPGTFNTIAPANGATGISTTPTLSWGVSSDATSYVYCIDTSNNSTCNTSWVDVGNVTSKALSGLLSNTQYYWVVRARNAAGYTYANSGTWRSFRTQVALPGTFNTIAPANGATGISTTPTLSWGVSSGATSYVYCIDTSDNSACNTSWVDVGNVTSKALSGLLSNTQYYWVVRARNAAGYTFANSGTWRSFHTQVALPGTFNTIAPANGATGISTTPTLSWGVSSGATSYVYCIDTSNNSACNTSWVDVGNVTSKALSGLLSNTQYYWVVRARNAAGYTYANSGTWRSFRTQVALPGTFNTIAPANGATGISTTPTLSWGVSSGATSYVYCIDTSNNSTCNTSWVDVGNVTSKALSGLLSNTQYYWVVRARNAAGYTFANGGTWWNFRTQ